MVHHIWLWRIAMAAICLSKRLHSIFLLRLFNDGPTMMLLYISLWLLMRMQKGGASSSSSSYWNTACVVFSLAVSIKMNVLLFAPGLLLLLLQHDGPNLVTVVGIRLGLACALPQVLLGMPFLLAHPVSYVRKAFELDRVFFYKWTVNWKVLPETVFVGKPWALALLASHVGVLIYMAVLWTRQWRNRSGQRRHQATSNPNQQPPQCWLSPTYIAHTMCTANFIGICFARTLHYQFYVGTTKQNKTNNNTRDMEISHKCCCFVPCSFCSLFFLLARFLCFFATGLVFSLHSPLVAQSCAATAVDATIAAISPFAFGIAHGGIGNGLFNLSRHGHVVGRLASSAFLRPDEDPATLGTLVVECGCGNG